MRVFTTAQIREFDKITIERFGVPSHSLMEIAGHKLFDEICRSRPVPKKVLVLLGRGNNGGDGLVISRLFILKRIKTSILLTEEIDKCSEDFKKNFEILKNVSLEFPYLEILKYDPSNLELLRLVANESDLIIDALLGTGMKSDLKPPYNTLIPFINSLNLKEKVIAIDIPSGLNGDTGSPMPDAIKASLTITIGGGKVGLYSYPAPDFTGEIRIIDIGLPIENSPEPIIEILDSNMFKSTLKREDINFHKGKGGHIGIIAGSKDRSGAAYLSILGALKAGAGLVTLISEQEVVDKATVLHPEVMTRELDYHNTDDKYISNLLTGVDSLVIGPGLPNSEECLKFIKNLISIWDKYLVLDAEALKLISDMSFDATRVVITPHPMELSRIIRTPKDEIQRDRIGYCIKCAQLLNSVVVLKGARSIIAKPSGDFTINLSGNQFMASGGMGDLLSGLIGTLVYQTGSTYEGARIGVYLHGLAADIAIKCKRAPLTATEVANYIKDAMEISQIYE